MDIATLNPADVASVYEGTASRCACGCSGTYWGPEYTDASEATNRLMVKRILARVQRRARKAAAGEVEDLGTYIFTDGSQCWFYQTSTRLIRVEAKCQQQEVKA